MLLTTRIGTRSNYQSARRYSLGCGGSLKDHINFSGGEEAYILAAQNFSCGQLLGCPEMAALPRMHFANAV